jgi:hypothetical protein
MAEHQDLQVLGGGIGVRQCQQAGERADDEREHEQHRRMLRSPCSRCESGFSCPTGHYELAAEEPVNRRVAVAFDELALAI